MRSISIILPCFNEADTLYENIARIHNYLKDRYAPFEIIAVNDGSTDSTLEELRRAQKDLGIKFIDKKINEGKGYAVRDGVAASRYEFVLFLDADLAIPIEELEKFMAWMGGASIVIASRFVPGLKIITPVLWYRKIMEKAFRLLRMVIINNYQIKDTQCGFKLFEGKCAREIFPMLRIRRFAFDAEVIFIASMRGCMIKELPITLQNPTTTSVRIFSDSMNMLIDLIRIRWNVINNVYSETSLTEKAAVVKGGVVIEDDMK